MELTGRGEPRAGEAFVLTNAAARSEIGPMGDEPAFTAFYHRTAPRLWKYLRRVSGNAALADDILQEAYLRFLRSARVGTSEPEQRSFLYRTATHLVYDHWRRCGRESRGLTRLWSPAPAGMATLGQDMSRVFDTLKPRDRAVLWLAYVEGWSHREIAAALGLGATSVKVLLFRARAVLARRLRRAGLRPSGGSR